MSYQTQDYDPAKDGPLSPATKKLNGPSQDLLDVHGQFTAELKRTDTKVTTMQEIYVVNGLTKPLLGRPAINDPEPSSDCGRHSATENP